MEIRADDLRGPEIAAFLAEHIRDMRAVSPPESKHALDLNGLRRPEITFWILWHEGQIGGCCALAQLDARHGEIKSMRTAIALRNRGIASRLLEHVVREATARGYARLSLETGAMPFFEAARRLYVRHGFVPCGPFSTYKDDPNSAFFTRNLAVEATLPAAGVPAFDPLESA
ncbi:GNAT family N-acetyltransferase [Opitutales bacterium ASA1]|uniref:GNAT family N-acetyltransferase n=1 Tax=Congregicoccus parvus TaxID=3081749 RepID=UPI002B2DB15F|nr:GNAT family N-acetyltransferase [Opitutales bacterium ASA1]